MLSKSVDDTKLTGVADPLEAMHPPGETSTGWRGGPSSLTVFVISRKRKGNEIIYLNTLRQPSLLQWLD